MLFALLFSLSLGDPLISEFRPPDARPAVSLGTGVSYPETALVYASYWPVHDVSLDATLSAIALGGGLTWHGTLSGPHDLLVNANAGWVHTWFRVGSYAPQHARLFAGAGYGYATAWDIRALVGVGSAHVATGWGWTPEIFLTVGHFI